MNQLQAVPTSLSDLQNSYDRLYGEWMGQHINDDQAEKMLDYLHIRPGESLLDMGCGTGHTVRAALDRGLDAVGVDISAVALGQAVEVYGLRNRVFLAAAEDLPWPDQTFDHISILGSLEHFLDPACSVREVARLLKPGGRAAILVPNSHHIRAIYNVFKYGEILSDLQDYERFATRREWERLFSQNGLRVETVHKYDTGMARIYRPGRELFWYAYNTLFRLFGNRWIPFNLTYTFIFICTPFLSEGSHDGHGERA
ncbi:MAG: methyltransferase domain-containing protein [Caldilineaceae bacterium]|nr:methyltransferase domain-containing protein [Caldilineaceae bacterium]